MEASGSPIRPRKLRLAVEMTVSPFAGIPRWFPMHGPQPGMPIIAPALTKVSMIPCLSAVEYISLEAGITNNLVCG